MNARILKSTGVFIAAMCLCPALPAQSDIALETRNSNLLELAERLRARDANDRGQVKAFAKRAGIPVRRVLPNGRIIEFQRFAPGIGPVIYVTYNLDAADTVSTDEVWPGGTAGLDLDGNGMTVGEWDGGAVYDAHPDLAGRVTQVDGVTAISEHSTHVAGTLIGAGADPFYPHARGMAYNASLDSYDWNSDTAEMAQAASNGLLISNHSYGIAAGWLYLGDVEPDTWWWIGGADPTDVEDINFGRYATEAQEWDQLAWNAPYYLIVKASGNDRWDTGPLPGETYTVIDQEGNPLFISDLPRNGDCAPAGYDCLPGNSVAKNILTVGAVDDIADGYAPLSGPGQVQMTGFSGWGPTDDGRIKPDIVGNGMWLVSTWPEYPGFAASLGTSMATPNVTGSLLLLQEHYEDLHGAGNFMRAATLKALAIHTADEAGGADGPDYEYGWGLLNTKKAAELITEDGLGHQLIEDSLSDSGEDSFEVNVPESDMTVKATIVWADPPGTPPPPVLDSPTLMLVNDLDLRLAQGPSNWLPWVLDPADPAAAAVRGDNFRDNVEQLVAEGLGAGTYSVKVNHKGSLLGGGPQDYSLVISVLPAPLVGAYPLIDEDFSGGMPAGWTVDTVQGVPWSVMAPVPGDPYLDNRTGGSGQFAIVNSDFSRTTTSLVTPTYDLSTATNVVLSFFSCMVFSDWETINVDVSANGGGNWVNVWQKSGLIGFPSSYVLDLTPQLGGQSNAVVRFRYHTYGDIMGYIWQVDNVKLDAYGLEGPVDPVDPPEAASNPFPANGELNVAGDIVLNWSAGSGADSHDVHFGTSIPPALQSNQGGTGYDPGVLDPGTTYYWRIDEINEAGSTSGSTWSFTTAASGPPDPVSSPSPNNGATGVAADVVLAWVAGAGASTYDVYFGTNPTPAFQANRADTSFDPGLLSPETTFYWRVDGVNAEGTTVGNTWNFTTAVLNPPDPASSPSPNDGSADVSTDVVLSWAAGAGTVSHDVFFGMSQPPAFQGSQAGTSFNPGGLAQDTTYYWRIDEVNADGATTGSVWSFTTVAPVQETQIHLANLEASSIPGARGRWTAAATVSVEDQLGAPVAGVLAEGTWSDGAKGDISCSTGPGGQCMVQKANLKSDVTSVTFTLSSLSASGTVYDSGANEVSEVILVPQDAGSGNLLPDAVNDSFSTTEGTPVSGNVMGNDDPGDTPATVTAYDTPSAQGGTVSMDSGGSFTYTPAGGFTGADSFGYTITDNNGDSDFATVMITVTVDTPPPAGLTLTATPVRIKGVWNTQLNWSGHSGSGIVSISRDGAEIAASTANDGDYLDEVGKKPASSYVYEVCEADSDSCATDTVNF